jgi:hypothetical protein
MYIRNWYEKVITLDGPTDFDEIEVKHLFDNFYRATAVTNRLEVDKKTGVKARERKIVQTDFITFFNRDNISLGKIEGIPLYSESEMSNADSTGNEELTSKRVEQGYDLEEINL